jgi:hypothetical protein
MPTAVNQGQTIPTTAPIAAAATTPPAVIPPFNNGAIPADRRWYLIIRGRQVGVVRGWCVSNKRVGIHSLIILSRAVCAPLVINVPGVIFRQVQTQEMGKSLFQAAQAANEVLVIDTDG